MSNFNSVGHRHKSATNHEQLTMAHARHASEVFMDKKFTATASTTRRAKSQRRTFVKQRKSMRAMHIRTKKINVGIATLARESFWRGMQAQSSSQVRTGRRCCNDNTHKHSVPTSKVYIFPQPQKKTDTQKQTRHVCDHVSDLQLHWNACRKIRKRDNCFSLLLRSQQICFLFFLLRANLTTAKTMISLKI